jgi:hypothetical protein
MLVAHADHIATPLCGVEQEREPESGLGSDRMMRLELCDLFVGPTMESGS